MLNTFPTLLSFAIFIPFIFRICVALFLIQIVITLKNKKVLKEYFSKNNLPFSKHLPFLIQIGVAVSATFLILGLYTQITSLISVYFLFTIQGINKQISFMKHSDSAFSYITLLCFSLLFLGAGAFAFDIPL